MIRNRKKGITIRKNIEKILLKNLELETFSTFDVFEEDIMLLSISIRNS